MMRAGKIRDLELTPSGSPEAAAIKSGVERLSWLMDDLIRIPVVGWRIGLDAIIGLIPGFGDTATSLVSFYILASAVRYQVPRITLLRMGMNLGIDYLLGSMPVVGDLFDAWWKANRMNVRLLQERALVSQGTARGETGDWLFVALIILLLIGIAAGAAFVSVYLLVLIARGLGLS
jgi:hypothetical protein